MQYSVAHFQYNFTESWQQELFEQALCDIGFDTFDGTDAYIQTSLLNEEELKTLLAENTDVTLSSIELCEDRNWNETWEAEHPVMELPLGVRIVPHCAFGAGYHETTSMIIDALLQTDLIGKTVLDNGCGTGVLGIMAAKLGAQSVVAIDIDDKSVANTIENAQLNNVTIDARLGDTPPAGHYDLVLSNIHRNILLAQMATYAQILNTGGELWLSGFYREDVPILTEAAKEYNLHVINHQTRGDWQLLQLQK